MRKPFMVANWKMHGTHFDTMQWIQALSYQMEPSDYDRVDVGVAPPFTSLRTAQIVIGADDLPIHLVAQNLHWADKGAYTGEVSAAMLSKLSVSYVIVGHSERRQMFGEDDRTVNRKVRAALAADLLPIVAIGEQLEERDAGQAEEVINLQLSGALARIPAEQVGRIVIAYEPVWAIGTGRTAEPAEAQKMIRHIRSRIRSRHPEAAEEVRILYGGSMNPGNVAALMAKPDIDGGLIGGASLDPHSLAGCVKYWT